MSSLLANLLGESVSSGDQLNPQEDHIDPLTGESITDDQLNEDFVLGENALTDFFLGHDHDAHEEAMKILKQKSITASEKEKALDEIDALIDNSNRVFTMPTFTKGLLSYLPGVGLWAMLGRAVSSKDRKKYREALYDTRSLVKAMKVSK